MFTFEARPRALRALLALLTLSLFAAACGGGGPDAGAADPAAEQDQADDEAGGDVEAGGDDEAGGGGELSASLIGAGATFPTPLFQDWIFEYTDNVQPGVSINYQSVGSGAGIEQFLSESVDFGSSERFLSDEDLEVVEEGRGCEALQIPVVFGAVTIAYDEQTLGEGELILDAETVSAIFRTEITSWSDERIAELNPDRELPDADIIPVHRSDGSGTTSVFTTWLEDEDEAWADELGSGTEVQWAAGTIGGEGNEGVTAGIQQNAGGVGYINQAYALENDLPTASIVNSDGNAVQPTLEATTAAVETVDIPDDFRFDILGVGGDGYPIAGTNWIFAYTCGYDEETAEALRDFWTWAVEEGDDLALELGYAPTGEGLKTSVLDAINRINEDEE